MSEVLESWMKTVGVTANDTVVLKYADGQFSIVDADNGEAVTLRGDWSVALIAPTLSELETLMRRDLDLVENLAD